MSQYIIGLGEILWDEFSGSRHLGGAPANFAYHAGELGAEARIVSRVGRDADGKGILAALKQKGISTEGIVEDPQHPTGSVTVAVSGEGSPTYQIHEQVAWDYLQADATAMKLVSECRAICFGSLAQRSAVSRKAITRLVEIAPADALRVFDVNIRQHYYSRDLLENSLALSNVVKLNEDELAALVPIFHLTGSPEKQIAQLAEQHDLQTVAFTRDLAGSMVLQGTKISVHPGFRVEVKDSVGAGDAFTAALTLGLLASWDLDKINQVANEVAAFVCAEDGAMPVLPDKLKNHFSS